MALVIEVNARLAFLVHQYVGNHMRRQLWRTPVLDVGRKWLEHILGQKAEEGICVTPEAGSRASPKFS
jgi:hypothetical protein